MIGPKYIKEFLEKCKEKKPQPTYRDFKASGFIRKKFGWLKKLRYGVMVVYNGKEE